MDLDLKDIDTLSELVNKELETIEKGNADHNAFYSYNKNPQREFDFRLLLRKLEYNRTKLLGVR